MPAVRTTTLAIFCLLTGACSGASNTLGNLQDSGAPMSGDSGSSSGGDSGGGVTDSSMSGPESGGTCSPTPPDDGACNSLQPTGPQVPYQCLAATLPTPTGGTIVDGTYVLTASAFYGTPCPAPEQDRDVWLVCGTVWQTAQEHTMGTGAPMLYSFDANVTPAGGADLSLEFTCGAGMVETITFQYSATPTTLTLWVSGTDSTDMGRVDTYTRQ